MWNARARPAASLVVATMCAAHLGCAPADEGGATDRADRAYPSRPVEIVSWATPGGPSDLLARALARVGPAHFGGQRLQVVTRQGGSGATAMQYLAGRRGDGHALAIFTASGAVNMATGRIPFRPGDFTPLLRIQRDPFLVAVRSDSDLRTLTAFFATAAEHPGQLSIAGFGAASAHFLAFARLSARAGDPDVRWIPYEGSGEAVIAALGGHTDAVHTNYNIVREHVRAGTMRALGVSEPLDALPGVPTYADQGFDVAPVHWRGVVGPPGLDAVLAADIRARLLATIEDPAFRAYMEEAAMEYAVMESSEAFGRWMDGEVEAYRASLIGLGLVEQGG